MAAALWSHDHRDTLSSIAVDQASGVAQRGVGLASSYSLACTHALGGGHVGPGGDFLHFRPECQKELEDYFSEEVGAYYAEVRTVVDAAELYFADLVRNKTLDGTQVVVFDIDETVLSNKAGWFTHDGAFAKVASLRGAVSTESFKAPHSKTAPPLAAMLELYTFLHKLGYKLAFLTGRNEAARADTAYNLQYAGYGRACPVSDSPIDPDTADGIGTSDSQQRRSERSSGSGSGDDAGAQLADGDELLADGDGTGSGSSSQRRPCYVRLLMREVGDERWASIFKPEARGKLVAEGGYEIVGNFGDQFSDLVGPNGASGSFKLPNPVYNIL